MSILAWPTCAFITAIEWTPPDPPVQVNRSEWTGREQITVLQPAGRWMAKVSVEPKQTEDDALDFQALRVQLGNRANAIRLPATLNPQFASAIAVTVNGAGQTGLTLNVNGPTGTVLKRGHKITVGDQLLMVLTTVTFASGHAALTLSNPLRASPANAAAVEIVNPTCLVKLPQPDSGWTGSYPNMIDFTQLALEETF
jgi:hypothetical protein